MNPINNILVIVDPTARAASWRSRRLRCWRRSWARAWSCTSAIPRQRARRARCARRQASGSAAASSNLKAILEELARPMRERGPGCHDGSRMRRSAAHRVDRSCATHDRRSRRQGHASSLARQAHVPDEHGLGADPRVSGAAAADQAEPMGERAESVRGGRSGTCERQAGRTGQPHRGLRRARWRRGSAASCTCCTSTCPWRSSQRPQQGARRWRYPYRRKTWRARRSRSARCCKTSSLSTESHRATCTWRWAGRRQSCRVRLGELRADIVVDGSDLTQRVPACFHRQHGRGCARAAALRCAHREAAGLRSRPAVLGCKHRMTSRAPIGSMPIGARAAICLIEIRLRELRQLFNTLDPAPFHEKDLDPAAEEYVVSAMREIGAHPSRLAVASAAGNDRRGRLWGGHGDPQLLRASQPSCARATAPAAGPRSDQPPDRAGIPRHLPVGARVARWRPSTVDDDSVRGAAHSRLGCDVEAGRDLSVRLVAGARQAKTVRAHCAPGNRDDSL